jgi:hypothetical protein
VGWRALAAGSLGGFSGGAAREHFVGREQPNRNPHNQADYHAEEWIDVIASLVGTQSQHGLRLAGYSAATKLRQPQSKAGLSQGPNVAPMRQAIAAALIKVAVSLAISSRWRADRGRK